jgi:hypothetical protein
MTELQTIKAGAAIDVLIVTGRLHAFPIASAAQNPARIERQTKAIF